VLGVGDEGDVRVLERRLPRGHAADGNASEQPERVVRRPDPRSRLDDVDAAQDACQDALLRAWQAMDRFQGDAEDFRRWLVPIVINALHDRLRAQGRPGESRVLG